MRIDLLKPQEDRVMAIFRTTLLAVLLLLGSHALSAQTTYYVRANGNDANDGLTEATAKLTIGGVDGAATPAVNGDIIDVGAGTFAGATFTESFIIQGAQANAPQTGWPADGAEHTVINSAITLNAANLTLTVSGVRFYNETPFAPVNNGATTPTDAIVTLTNCRFDNCNAITTTAWSELVVMQSAFVNGNTGITATGLDVLQVEETTFTTFTGTAIDVSGATGSAFIRYNEFTTINSGNTASNAAVKLDVASLTGEVEVHKNILDRKSVV